jgi:hypothetical protein
MYHSSLPQAAISFVQSWKIICIFNKKKEAVTPHTTKRCGAFSTLPKLNFLKYKNKYLSLALVM